MLFYINKTDSSVLDQADATTLDQLGWKEKDLENLVAQHIDKVIRENQLLVVAQERQYQEEADILALDRDGDLHIFELKRWKSQQENLLQVLRYGQRFGQYKYRALQDLLHSYMQRAGKLEAGASSPDLAKTHADAFELETPLGHEFFNRKQHFIVMTNGLDRATREALAYWRDCGLSVHALVYRVYALKGGDVLFELEPYGPEGDAVEDREDGLVVVNTNATYMPNAYKDMLAGSKASAYLSRKWAVSNVARGTPIALYHTGLGVIAFGKTVGDVHRGPCGKEADGEHYVPCEFEYVVDPAAEADKAVTARAINQHLGASHRFRQTVYTLPIDAASFIKDTMKKNGATKPSKTASGK